MGEKALKFSPLADMELLSELLESTAGVLAGLKGSMSESAANMEARAKQNAELRARLKGMKGEMNSQLGNGMNKMMGMMGADPMDLLTDEEVDKLLVSTFQKFDRDNSGQLERPEFHKAWEFLGLEGSMDQVNRAFDGVDIDKSGIVDRREFCEAIRNSRLAELSLTVLLTNMDGHLEGMEQFFVHASLLWCCSSGSCDAQVYSQMSELYEKDKKQAAELAKLREQLKEHQSQADQAQKSKLEEDAKKGRALMSTMLEHMRDLLGANEEIQQLEPQLMPLMQSNPMEMNQLLEVVAKASKKYKTQNMELKSAQNDLQEKELELKFQKLIKAHGMTATTEVASSRKRTAPIAAPAAAPVAAAVKAQKSHNPYLRVAGPRGAAPQKRGMNKELLHAFQMTIHISQQDCETQLG
jgi:DNA repair exonuclease SbcCD ATPase subunit